MKQDIVLVGGGGHCKACIDVIEQVGTMRIRGIVDLPERVGQSVLGYAVIADDRDLPRLVREFDAFLVTLGQIATARRRIALYEALKDAGARLPTVVSPLAYVANSSRIGEGSIVMHHAVVNAAARIGNNCIINTKALVEHDAQVFDHCHISTGAIVNGGAVVGRGSFIGSNSVCQETAAIPNGSVVGFQQCVRAHKR